MTVRRVLTLTLILLLAIMPYGLAESVYGQLTLNNFQVALAGGEPVDVDAVLKLGGGYSEEDGLFRADAELTGGGKTAFTAAMDAVEDALRVKLGGANIYFTLPYETLASTQASGQYADAFKDRKAFVAYIAKTVRDSTAASGADPLAKPIAAVRKALKAEAKGEENVELFGETMNLYRFDASLDNEALSSLLEALAESDDAIKSTFVGAIREMEGSFEAGALKEDDIAGSFAAILEKSKFDFRADVTFWADAPALNDDAVRRAKATAKLTVTQPAASEDAEATTTELTIDLAVMDKGEGEYTTLAIHLPKGSLESIDMNIQSAYNVPKDGGTANSVFLTTRMDGLNSISYSLESTTDAAGVTDASFSIKMPITGQPLGVNIRYDGKTATANRYEGVVTIDSTIEEFKGIIQFDALLETGPLVPLADKDFEGLTAVNPLDPKDENAKLVMPEMAAVGAKASGVFMTTPGIPQLVSIFGPAD